MLLSFDSQNLKDGKYFSFLPQLDKCVITGIAMGNEDMRNRSLVKEWCQTDLVMVMATAAPCTCRHYVSHSGATYTLTLLPVKTTFLICVFITDALSFFLSVYSPLAM